MPADEVATHREARNEAREAGGRIARVPVAGDLDGVLLREHGVEDRLVRQAGRELAPAARLDQLQLRTAHGAVQGDGVRNAVRVTHGAPPPRLPWSGGS